MNERRKRRILCIETGEEFPNPMDEKAVREARGLVCLACCDRGPMADGSGIEWCETCPVSRIRSIGK